MSGRPYPKASDVISVNGIEFSHGDLLRQVDLFYTRIQEDHILSVPFQSVHDWPEHIQRLTHFWWIRLGGEAYMFAEYNPVPKHFYAGFNSDLLDRWLVLFKQTLGETLTEAQAHLWGTIASRIGEVLTYRHEQFKIQVSSETH